MGATAVLMALSTVASATLPRAMNTSSGDEMSVGRTPTSVWPRPKGVPAPNSTRPRSAPISPMGRYTSAIAVA